MIWMLITAGHGPAECELAVRHVVARVSSEAEGRGVEVDVVDAETAEHGLASALLSLNGDGSDIFARSWAGTVRWTCPSPFRRGWPRKNWFVGVSILSPPSPTDPLRVQDVRFEACRASGPGGQHVNKTSSAVRATHLPSGLSTFAQEERSQHRNKSLALARLAAALAEREAGVAAARDRERRGRHSALERGNEIRAFVGAEFTPVR